MLNWLPRLTYPITRNFKFRVEPIVYLIAIIAIGVLIPLNCESIHLCRLIAWTRAFFYIIGVDALTGFQIITVTQREFTNSTSQWFDHLTGTTTSQCDPFLFTTGESLTTSVGALTWTITSIVNTFTGNSVGGAVGYAGTNIGNICDVFQLAIVADASRVSATATISVACGPDFPVIMTASYAFVPFSGHEFTETNAVFNLTSILYVLPRRCASDRVV